MCVRVCGIICEKTIIAHTRININMLIDWLQRVHIADGSKICLKYKIFALSEILRHNEKCHFTTHGKLLYLRYMSRFNAIAGRIWWFMILMVVHVHTFSPLMQFVLAIHAKHQNPRSYINHSTHALNRIGYVASIWSSLCHIWDKRLSMSRLSEDVSKHFTQQN